MQRTRVSPFDVKLPSFQAPEIDDPRMSSFVGARHQRRSATLDFVAANG